MTSPVDSGAGWRRVQWLVEHPLVGLLAVVIPLLGLLLAVLAYVKPPTADPQSGTEPRSGGPTSAGAGPSSQSSATVQVGAAALAVGDCLDAAMQLSHCDAPHQAEVIDVGGACDHDILLTYLGGVPGDDVILSDVQPEVEATDTGDVCVVRPPAGGDSRAAQDALLGPDHGAWRRCTDVLGRELPCTQPHHDEVVVDSVPPGEAIDCASRATKYLGAPYPRHADDLRVEQRGDECVLAARGDNVLTASVRRLGTSALPLEPAD